MYSITLENLSEEAVKEILFGQFFVLGKDFAHQDAPLSELFTELTRATEAMAEGRPEFEPEPDPEPEPEYDDLVIGDALIDDDGEVYTVASIIWVPELRTWLINTSSGHVLFRYPGEMITLSDGEEVIAPRRS